MKKKLLIILMTFSSLANASFACGCGERGTTTLWTSICQKACQNVVSLINLDLSILSPRASIADLNVAGPQTTCCSKKQSVLSPNNDQKSMTPEDMQATIIPNNDLKSMAIDEDTGRIILVTNRQESMAYRGKEATIIPITNKQELKHPSIEPKSKTSLFRIDLFRRFKLQIL